MHSRSQLVPATYRRMLGSGAVRFPQRHGLVFGLRLAFIAAALLSASRVWAVSPIMKGDFTPAKITRAEPVVELFISFPMLRSDWLISRASSQFVPVIDRGDISGASNHALPQMFSGTISASFTTFTNWLQRPWSARPFMYQFS